MNASLPPTALRLLLGVLLAASSSRLPAAEANADGWISLFDGHSLAGWRPNENPGSVKVIDGAIVCDGPRSHLFYVGPMQGASFKNFEFEAEVLTRAAANSGIYFHTEFQAKDWPSKGFEVQVNNTATGEGGYRENKRTASLYAIRNLHRQLVPDDQWFTLRISVRGRRVVVHVNDVKTVDYVEPDHAPNGGYAGRKVDRGTFAIQCHDAGSRAHFRKLRVRALPDDLPADPTADAGAYVISPELAELHANNFPVIDLHTHLKGGLTLEDVLKRYYRTGINAGVAVNCGIGFPVTNDAGLDAARASIRHPLLFAGMQAEGREWVKLFSREAIARFDYVFTDAMTIFNDQGKRMRLWIPAETEVGETQAFMDLLVARTVAILEGEPIDIWVNPTYLPEVIAGDYAKLWTEARMQKVIEAAVRNGVAIEINDRFRIPSAAFLKKAQKAGAKFTFGTNNGGRDDLGKLDHSVRMVTECGLKWDDFWVPGARPSRARRGTP